MLTNPKSIWVVALQLLCNLQCRNGDSGAGSSRTYQVHDIFPTEMLDQLIFLMIVQMQLKNSLLLPSSVLDGEKGNLVIRDAAYDQ